MSQGNSAGRVGKRFIKVEVMWIRTGYVPCHRDHLRSRGSNGFRRRTCRNGCLYVQGKIRIRWKIMNGRTEPSLKKVQIKVNMVLQEVEHTVSPIPSVHAWI